MFINCKYCNALVATDPATDLPPERCPRCAGVLRVPPAATEPAAPSDVPAPQGPAAPSIPSLLAPSPDAPDPVPATTVPPPAEDDAPDAAAHAAADSDGSAPSVDPPVAEVDVEAESDTDVTADSGPAMPMTDPEDLRKAIDVPTSTDSVQAADATDGTDGTVAAPPPADDTPADGAADSDTDDTTATAQPMPEADDGAAVGPPRFLPARPRAAATASTLQRWLAPAVIALLTLLLGVQIVLADRDRLAADARWRPLVASLCEVFGCTLPAWHEPDAFTLLSRDVRPHPADPGTLRVNASFRNDARWAQDWPQVLLTLSDVNGRPVAARAFTADEYLATPATGPGLDSGQTASIRIEILEPAVATVSYAFDFR